MSYKNSTILQIFYRCTWNPYLSFCLSHQVSGMQYILKENFPLNQLLHLETLNRIVSLSDLYQICQIFFHRDHRINSEFITISEYFIFARVKGNLI